MAVGRFLCVALPLILTVASIVALLVATLSGVAHGSMYMFRINVANLTINPANVGSVASRLGINLKPRADAQTGNITAGNLGLADVYDVNLWGYCSTSKDGKRECTKAQFDWASSKLNTTWIETFGSAAGANITLPTEIKNSLTAFRTVTKWTEVAFIVALVALGVALLSGLFATCSRGMSCLTWLVASVAAVLVGLAAGLATAMAAIVIGAVEGTARFYGVGASFDRRFLASVWIATAFAMAAGFFWIFTICCCKPERRDRSSRADKHAAGEKTFPSKGYAPLTSDHEMRGAYYNPHQQSQPSQPPRYPSGTGRSDLAYEPYSHRA
ncbi:integral membrane protein [Drechmeria coniospora]|uniref:Integral membrane protein n=1 Tax=Drechmeria coniospora TaxID=98403 RepID=A0A151GC93_DRECN|nr:integral membrane protein [Drechmeria coniospora]KYK54710.1 integral membrane protein [Drechmeria coniospora]ODA76066.1 hypothetical protein RJ55_08349 [Drechmeria coniospora]